MSGNWIYDPSVLLPVAKANLSAPAPAINFVNAADWNLVATDDAGGSWLSEIRESFLQLRANNVFNLADAGADRTGAQDCTTIFNTLLASIITEGIFGAAVYLPKGSYKAGSILSPGSLGMSIIGDGPYATQINWNGSTGTDFLTINSSQACTLRDFTLNVPLGANRPRKMLSYSYDPVVAASSGNVIDNVWIQADGSDGPGKYDYGIYFSDGYGNNSEVTYKNVRVINFALNGITLPGTQQKNHVMYNCNLSGGWNGLLPSDPDYVGGQYGVMVGQGIVNPGVGGSFQFYGGGVGQVSKAAFARFYGNDPIIIESCQSEEVFRFLDTDPNGSPNTGTAPCIVRGCRMSFGAFDGTGAPNVADGSMVRLCDLGPFKFEGNTFEADFTSGKKAQIEINTGGPTMLDCTANDFSYADSVTHGPYNITGNYNPVGDLHNNTYTDVNGDNNAKRCEPLNVAPKPGALVISSSGDGEYWVSAVLSLFNAAATSQSVSVQGVPKGARIKSAFFYPPQTGPTLAGSHIKASLGTVSGGSNLLAPVKVSGATERPLGTAAWSKGPTLQCAGIEGALPDFTADTEIFLTLTSDSANLGDGTTSALSGGLYVAFFIEPRLRWLAAV